MEKEILISDDEYETRCAVLEEGMLNEIYIERKAATQTLGNLYKGRSKTFLPGMQVAFVDIGLDRHAFLHISDLKFESVNGDETDDENPDRSRGSSKNADTLDLKTKTGKQSVVDADSRFLSVISSRRKKSFSSKLGKSRSEQRGHGSPVT